MTNYDDEYVYVGEEVQGMISVPLKLQVKPLYCFEPYLSYYQSAVYEFTTINRRNHTFYLQDPRSLLDYYTKVHDGFYHFTLSKIWGSRRKY